MKKLKTIGISIVITLILSLIIGIITSNLIIRGIVLGVMAIGTLVVLLKKFRKSLWLVILPVLISAVVSMFVPILIQWSIVTVIISLIAVEKIPNPYKSVICVLLITILLTWILPTTYFNYDLVSEGANQVGIFSLLSYPQIAISYFGNIVLYLLAIGGFYGVLHKTGAYRKLLEKISKALKKSNAGNILTYIAFCLIVLTFAILFGANLFLLIAIIILLLGLLIFKHSFIFKLTSKISSLTPIVIVISLVTSVCGASQGVWIIIPFIISLVLLMGYDRITAAMVTILPITVGLIGNTFASTYISDAYGGLSQNGMGIVNTILKVKATSLIIPKVILLVLGIAITIASIYLYVFKHKTNKKEEDNLIPIANNKKVKIWPLVVVFDLIFIITMLSLTSWTSVFNLNWFQKATEWVNSIEIAGFPIFTKILGNVKAFEQWSIDEISVLLVFGSIILAMIYKIKVTDFIDEVAKGAKKALKPAVLVILVYVILVIVSYHPIVLTIIKPLLTNKFNALTMGLSTFISNIFNVDLYYSASTTLPYIASIIKDTAVYPTIALAWQTMHGFAALVAPTSLLLVVVLSYLDIPYTTWLKANWKTIIGMLVLIFIVLIAIVLFV